MDWKEYVLGCFDKDNFVNVPSDIQDVPGLWRCKTYEEIRIDILERGGPIATTALSLLFKPKVIVEFGVYVGWTSLYLCKLNPEAEVHGVDYVRNVKDIVLPMSGRVKTGYGPVLHQCSNYKLHIMNSWEFQMTGKVDLCFIDANHDEKPVWMDCWTAWNNRNKEGNWCIAFDDYHSDNKGVVSSVNKFVQEVGYPLQKIGSWFYIAHRQITEKDLEDIGVGLGGNIPPDIY